MVLETEAEIEVIGRLNGCMVHAKGSEVSSDNPFEKYISVPAGEKLKIAIERNGRDHVIRIVEE